MFGKDFQEQTPPPKTPSTTKNLKFSFALVLGVLKII